MSSNRQKEASFSSLLCISMHRRRCDGGHVSSFNIQFGVSKDDSGTTNNDKLQASLLVTMIRLDRVCFCIVIHLREICPKEGG